MGLNNFTTTSGTAEFTDIDVSETLTDPSGTVQRNKLIGAFETKTPTAFFSGPAHGEGSFAFQGATLLPDDAPSSRRLLQ
jgi:hypothetical protein